MRNGIEVPVRLRLCLPNAQFHALTRFFFVKTLLSHVISNLNRHRDDGASDLKDSGSATPASIKFTFYQVRTEPRTNAVVAGAKSGALYAPRGASSKETMGDDETTLELRSTSILSLSSHTTHAEFDRRKKPISRGRRRLFSRQREQRRPETHRGKYCGQADSSTRMLRLRGS